MNMIKIKNIPSSETYAIRQAVLRPGQDIASCVFEGDDLPATIHFGLYYDDEIYAVISVYENKNVKFTEKLQFQIRGMAVIQNAQKKGFGRLLMLEVEKVIKTSKADILWFNAREAAVGFYVKLGYLIIDEPFIIGNIGTHYVMYKQL